MPNSYQPFLKIDPLMKQIRFEIDCKNNVLFCWFWCFCLGHSKKTKTHQFLIYFMGLNVELKIRGLWGGGRLC